MTFFSEAILFVSSCSPPLIILFNKSRITSLQTSIIRRASLKKFTVSGVVSYNCVEDCDDDLNSAPDVQYLQDVKDRKKTNEI